MDPWAGFPKAPEPVFDRIGDCSRGQFTAMGSPCSLLVDTDDAGEAEMLTRVAACEALRIERTFSRYRTDNVIHRINHSRGQPVSVDEETAKLLDYAATCYEISDGLFDITSGVLRRAWTFDGGSRVPSRRTVRALLQHVGWHRVNWNGDAITMPVGMEIDFGGIGKEYAVDLAAALVTQRTNQPFLVNFGGDLFASGEQRNGRPWRIGIDDPQRTGDAVLYRVELQAGGLATSGDARRFVRYKGRRLGHILNPRTGWPVEHAPQAITVIAGTCLEAGALSTMAYLQGKLANQFLEAQEVQYQLV